MIKVYRQTHSEQVSYLTAANNVIEKDGVLGLFGRGLKTKILSNGMQGILFSVLWKHIDEKLKERNKKNQWLYIVNIYL